MNAAKRKNLITLDEAIDLVKEYWNGKVQYSKKTFYNKIHKGELTRHGPPDTVLVDKEEVLARFCA